MQFSTFIPVVLALLPALVASEACVAGGPADQVNYAKNCCFYQSGTWYQYYPVQAICVFADNLATNYKTCISYIRNSELDTTCIPGNGDGLVASTGTATETISPTASTTITPTLSARAFVG